MLAVGIHISLTLLLLFVLDHKFKLLFLGAYIARVAFLLWDLYARDIYILPNSGADSEMYFYWAKEIGQNLYLLGQNARGGLYSKIIGVLFHLIGPSRLFGQYLNVLLGLSVVFIIDRILMMLDVKDKSRNFSILLASFFPNSLIMSAVFLREILPTFFVALSLLAFMIWYQNTKYRDMVLAITYLGVASMFHSGVIGIFIGYAFAFLFYNKETGRFKFSIRSVTSFFVILAIVSIAFTYYGNQILYKFQNLEDVNDLISQTNRRLGGSAYLTSLKINTPIQLLFYGPIKSFFFLTSPLPMNWRGFMDIFTFFSDSLLYLGTLIYMIANRKRFGDRRTLIFSIVVMIVGAAFIFGIGVANAGTAVRHRQKIVPLFIILLAVMMHKKEIICLRSRKNNEKI